jgi:hypothetical protein
MPIVFIEVKLRRDAERIKSDPREMNESDSPSAGAAAPFPMLARLAGQGSLLLQSAFIQMSSVL